MGGIVGFVFIAGLLMGVMPFVEAAHRKVKKWCCHE